MKVICYMDANGEQRYDKLNPPPDKVSTIVDNWQQAHPNFKIMHVFDSRSDILTRTTKERRMFEDNCELYGFNYDDLYAKIKFANTTLTLVGFDTRKKKYKVRWIGENTGHRVGMSVDYAKSVLQHYRIS